MSNQTVTKFSSFAEELLAEVILMEKMLEKLRRKILLVLPEKYGSEAWWKKSDDEAIESIKAGRGKKFETYEEAVKYLHS